MAPRPAQRPYLPTDGQANPSAITQSLAKGAQMAG